MANLGSSYQISLLDFLFNGGTFVPPSALYVGLVDDNATDADVEGDLLTNEITGYDGDRLSVTWTAATDVDGKATIYNVEQLDFTQMPATTVKYAVLCTTATKGTGSIFVWIPAAVVRTTSTGDVYRIPANDLILTLD